MARYQIRARNSGYSGFAHGLMFRGGVAETDNTNVLDRFRRNSAFTVLDAPESGQLDELTVAELKGYAAEHNIELPSDARKADIIAAIEDAEQ